MKSKIEVLEILRQHCRVLARADDPWKRIAASEVEIELRERIEKLKAESLPERPACLTESVP